MQINNDHIESAISYTVGGSGFLIAHMADLTNAVQFTTIVFACLVVGVRLTHDIIKLIRYIKNGK